MFSFTDRGARVNEDFARTGTGQDGAPFGVLLDGASDLCGFKLFSDIWGSDARWLSHTTGNAACAELERGASIEDALEAGVSTARRELEERTGQKIDDIEPDAIPSATVAVARALPAVVELAWLGDSPLVVKFADSGRADAFVDSLRADAKEQATRTHATVVVLSSNDLAALDAQSKQAMVERSRGQNMSGAEKREAISDILKKNRQMINKPGGYWNLDPTGKGLPHLNKVTVAPEDIEAIAAFSDGFYAAFETYKITELDAFLASATEADSAGKADARHCASEAGCTNPMGETCATALLEQIRAVEGADPDFNRFTRFKISDDASMFLLSRADIDRGAASRQVS